MIEMLRIYSKGYLENVTIEELNPRSPSDENGLRSQVYTLDSIEDK